MTITLHWWMLPVGILIAAVIATWVYEKTRYHGSHWDMDIFGPIIFLFGLVAAISVTIGHFI